jgi:ABC-type nitrate/sulfonate/bicarbonate transport system ATPase subunit
VYLTILLHPFTSALPQAKLITEISGGWKMKLALARAMLLRADILLLARLHVAQCCHLCGRQA